MIIIATGVFGSATLAPRPAQADLPVIDMPGDAAQIDAVLLQLEIAAAEAEQVANDAKQSTWDILKIALTNTATLALLNGANYFAQKIAYDTANYIASGGKGQKPLFSVDGIEGELKSAAQDSAGEVLGTLSKDPTSFGKFGVNLCAPSDPRVALNIKLGFLSGLPGMLGTSAPTQPKPTCTWDTISNNWDQFANQDSSKVLDQIGVMFTPGQSSLSAAIDVNNAALALISDKQQAAVNKFIANSGFKDLTDKISGKIKTPADTIKQEQGLSIENGWKEGDKTVFLSGSAIQNAAFGILPAMLQTFAGTLSQKLLTKVFEKGLISVNQLFGSETDTTLTFGAAPVQGGRAAAELANMSLLTPKILTITNYNALTDFAACPSGGPRNPNNCVMDGQFFAGVNRASQGTPLTVRQAAAQGFLHDNWPLLPLAHGKNREQNCFDTAYCYSNLVKLRKSSILPIGWELAANSAFNDVSHPVTLVEAMDHFEDCPRNTDNSIDETKLPDPLHPWCHLVDPEWVLKYPIEICRQQAPGPTLVSSQTAARAQTCVDPTTCIAQDASGNCTGGYGYCVREKNVWNIDADSCPAYYASCTTFKRADTGDAFSFLSNTLDAGQCNSQNAGCRQYSQSTNAVPDAGFEDAVDGLPRDWTLVGAAYSRSGFLAEHGVAAIGVSSGISANAKVYSLQPGASYTLSSSVLQEHERPNSVGTVSLQFFNEAGLGIATSALVTTCKSLPAAKGVSLDVIATHLGYLSGSCTFTAPPDATSGSIQITSDSPAGNRTWFDDLGLYGGSYSASPYDSLLLNGHLQKCASDQAGCTDLVRMSTATINLIRDPGFETPGPVGSPGYWFEPATPGKYVQPASYENGTLKGFEGVSALRLGATGASQDVQGLLGDAVYSFSLYSKKDGANANPRVVLQLFDNGQQPVAPVTSSGCLVPTNGTTMTLQLAEGADFDRSGCTFTTPSDVASLRVTLLADASTVLADAVQLELAITPSDYHDGYSSGAGHVYLKVAPEGLNCSGPNRDPACSTYAPACRRDEVGCDSYTPDGGGTAIPAVTVDSDACPLACVGYDTFREEPSTFNDARFPLFLIPSSARSCAAAESGCSEFTNVQKLAQGGESREYFSYLRQCVKPDQNAGTFYTYEGNDTSGIHLRTWTLLKSQVLSAPAGSSDPTGGNAPCSNLSYDTNGQPACSDDAVSLAAASCRKSDLLFNPDCREFYDVAGNIHYRLYSKTIVVSDACTEYRITKSTAGECATHGGLSRNGECHYFSYAPESQSCRPDAAACRSYSGNASRNVHIVFSDGFETGTTSGWTAAAGGPATLDVINSNESVTAGGHSLKVNRQTVYKDAVGSIGQGKSYLVTFWAKGKGDLSMSFSTAGDHPFTVTPLALGTEWKPFQVGPVLIVQAPASDPNDHSKDEQLAIALSGAGTFAYLDNIELHEISDDVYLIQDSWTTPDACDQAPSGDSSPQYMLGCRAYKDRANAAVPLKSFDRICRPEAVGCEALYDTHHSASVFPQTFGAVCSLPLGQTCGQTGALTCPCLVANQTVCQVVSKATSCRYDSDDSVPQSRISPDRDTVRIPADSVTYLVNDRRYGCDQANDGCTAMGDKILNKERTAVSSWSTIYGLNRPADYANILCKQSELFCQAYTRQADGSAVYFKQPEQRTCEYKTDTDGFSGWFKSGTSEPCYPGFLQAGTRYGIWKNSDSAYDSWVGVCQPQFDMCKEFIDPQDTSESNQGGQPYYAIKNDRLDSTTCQGNVSLTRSPSGANVASACVLFWQTDNLVKNYDSAATYMDSDDQHGALVSAKSGAANDSNIVLRVSRDRQCGEWLDCRSSENVFNQSSGQFQNVCTTYSLCAQYEVSGNASKCVKYVDSEYAGKTLTTKVYQTRDTGWNGLEYTSYAIPNQYPVNELVTIDVSPGGAKPDPRLVRSIGACNPTGVDGAYGSACGPADDQGRCLGPSGSMKCVYPIDDGYQVTTSAVRELKQTQAAAGYPGTSCRAYPDENAPFPSTVADPNGWNLQTSDLNQGNPVLISPTPAFAKANVCQRRLVNGVEVSDCECNYVVAKYGASTKYFSTDSSDLPLGYCSAGAYDGYECDPLATGVRSKKNLSCCSKTVQNDLTASFGVISNNGCDDGAQCSRLTKIDRVVGYEGQCLERDFTTPINGRNDEFACVTWRPVGQVGGSRDIYNQNQSAGYFAAADRRFYCVGTQDAWQLGFEIQPQKNGRPDVSQPMINWGPEHQDTKNYFGPGVVTNGNPRRALSQHLKCEDDNQVPTGDWCIWPTDVTDAFLPKMDGSSPPKPVTCTKAEADGGTGCGGAPYKCVGLGAENPKYECGQQSFTINNDAVGILGCYEVADAGSYKQTFIDYPYIGPALYRQQLHSIYFQMTNDIYFDDSSTFNLPTNPNNQVQDDCNDDNDDSNVSPPDSLTHDAITINDLTRTRVVTATDSAGNTTQKTVFADNANHTKGLYFLDEAEDWKVDASNGGGTILLSANFDKNGLLQSIRVAADDHEDSGTFGINRMGFLFNPGCSEVVQVDQTGEFGATTAFTSTINPYRNFDGRQINDVTNKAWKQENACRPFGVIGSIASTPVSSVTGLTTSPWTYVATRITPDDIEQCTQTDYVKGAGYKLDPPESVGLQSLRQIFRKIYGVWQYFKLQVNGQGGTYSLVDANPAPGGTAYDETKATDPASLAARGNASWQPPHVAAVNLGICDPQGHCKAGLPDTLTVNGKQDGVVLGADGSMSVTAKFFAWASHNAMPILQRRVMWGDYALSEPPARGWYKNQKPICSPDTSDQNAVGECLNGNGLTCTQDGDCPGNATTSPPGGACIKGVSGFGDTPGACNAAPFQFDHIYTCSLKDLQGMPLCDQADPNSPVMAGNAPCYRLVNNAPICVYRPKVQITDNWGWCNCTGSACDVAGGAYGAACGTCNTSANAKPWNEFAGEIRLQPSIKDAQAFPSAPHAVKAVDCFTPPAVNSTPTPPPPPPPPPPSGSVCGNGSCESGESAASCSSDCSGGGNVSLCAPGCNNCCDNGQCLDGTNLQCP